MRLAWVLFITAFTLTVQAAEDLPLVAVWRSNEGHVLRTDSQIPYLRVAIWPDGRFIVAKDPAKWAHDLERGSLSPEALAKLKKDLAETSAFDLKRTSYLVPDGGCNCALLKLGEKEVLLQWDEVETPNYGLNINPTPETKAFKACWKALNTLALGACPEKRESIKTRFVIPDDWLVLRAVRY